MSVSLIVKHANKMKKQFTLTGGTYDDTIYVSVGTTYQELKDWFTTLPGNEDLPFPHEKDLFGDSYGFFEDTLNIIWLDVWDNSEHSNDILRHEVHHAVQKLLAISRGMYDEYEALAYQQDYLIRSIRSILNTEE